MVAVVGNATPRGAFVAAYTLTSSGLPEIIVGATGCAAGISFVSW
jgi:hypothetical protein